MKTAIRREGARAWRAARRGPLAIGAIVASLGAMSAPAYASDNDLELSRLADFEPRVCGTNGENICGTVVPRQGDFERITTDLGEVFSPRLANPAETLGEAGFAVGVMVSLSSIPSDDAVWQEVIEDRDPPGVLTTGHVQVRKGLPFSFEIAGNMAYLFGSEMFAMGADLKWALHEGFFYMPNVAVRGSVNTVLGAEYLNLINAGWDVSISKDFGIDGMFSISPFAGYQNLYVIGSSRLINAYPQDPRPPQTGDTPSENFAPEFVFEQYTANLNRFFLGARLNVWILSFVLEGMLGDQVNQFTLSAGLDF